MQLKMPNLGTVARSRSPRLYLVPTPVVGADGTVAEILLNPVGGPYGPLPSDPSRFPASIYPRTAVCHILHGRPGVRCTRAGLLLNAGGGDRSCSSQPSPSSSPSPR